MKKSHLYSKFELEKHPTEVLEPWICGTFAFIWQKLTANFLI